MTSQNPPAVFRVVPSMLSQYVGGRVRIIGRVVRHEGDVTIAESGVKSDQESIKNFRMKSSTLLPVDTIFELTGVVNERFVVDDIGEYGQLIWDPNQARPPTENTFGNQHTRKLNTVIIFTAIDFNCEEHCFSFDVLEILRGVSILCCLNCRFGIVRHHGAVDQSR